MEIFRNEKYAVCLVSGYKEAQGLGAGSGQERLADGGRQFHPHLEWCISVLGDDDYARRSFDSYSNSRGDVNPCYFIISLKDPTCDKFCIIPSRTRFHRPGAFVDNMNMQLDEGEMEAVIGKDLMDQIREHSEKWFEARTL